MKPQFKTMKGFVIGFISCAVLASGVANASDGGSMVEVFFKQLKYKINGEMKSNLEGQGFIYKDTTYVPLRMVTEALGNVVGWDGYTNTISISKAGSSSQTATTTASDAKSLTTFPIKARDEAQGFLAVNEWGMKHNSAAHKKFTINNQTYIAGFGLYMHNSPYPPFIKSGGNVDIKLEGYYSRFTALVGADDSNILNNATGTLKIFGDYKELLSVTDIRPGQDAKTFDIDVTGVQLLTINFQSDRNGILNMIIANPQVTLNRNPTSVTTKSPVPAAMVTPTPAAPTPVISVPQPDSGVKDISQSKGPVEITTRDKFGEAVGITNTGGSPVDIKGWKLVSTNGGETYIFTDSLIIGPYGGRTLDDYTVSVVSGNFADIVSKSDTFPPNYKIWSKGEIWDNNAYDNAELYDASGRLVSRYSCNTATSCPKKPF